MKICVTSCNSEPNSAIDQRFGRCAYFCIYDTDTDTCESFANEFCNSPHGAGTGAAQKIINKGVSVVITGVIGPKAMEVLQAAQIKTITGKIGSVTDAINDFKQDK